MLSRLRGCCGLLVLALASLAGCATHVPNKGEKPIPRQETKPSLTQLGKTDFDLLTDVEVRENTQSLRLLMVKLYKRNPRELRKNWTGSAEDRAKAIFEGQQEWHFAELNGLQGTDAIQQAFRPEFAGDRVLSFIVGLESMLLKAHGGKSDFYMTDSVDPQKVYNAARNVEIAVWKLSNARDASGQLFLLTNEINDTERNLSFEREFGKIIGSLDLYAIALAEKQDRSLLHVVQSFATALFLPF